MEKNSDSRVITIDAEIFESILYYARCGAQELGHEETLRKHKRHIRKFNPLSKQVGLFEQEQKEHLEEAKALRKYSKRARRLVCNRKLDEGMRVFWLYDGNRKMAWPIHVHNLVPEYGPEFVAISFVVPEHKTEALYRYDLKSKETVRANRIAETREMIPVNTNIVEA